MEQEMNKAILEENTATLEVVETNQAAEENTSAVAIDEVQAAEQVSFNVEKEQKRQKVQNILKNIFKVRRVLNQSLCDVQIF